MIELLIVLAIVALLTTLAVPRYFQSVDTTRERVLVNNLRSVRETIDKFFSDTGRYPESLQELVERKYLKALPIDPMTESSSTWIVVPPEEPYKGGVADIHSGAQGSTRDEKAYAEL